MFKEFFKPEKITEDVIEKVNVTVTEAEDNIQKIRDAGLKIKTVIPTRFGNEVVFFKERDAEEAQKLIKDSQIDGKSIFIGK